jgi:hypothetical protein
MGYGLVMLNTEIYEDLKNIGMLEIAFEDVHVVRKFNVFGGTGFICEALQFQGAEDTEIEMLPGYALRMKSEMSDEGTEITYETEWVEIH